jgi:hypothetical protein
MKWKGTQILIRGRWVRPGMRFAHRRWTVAQTDGTSRPDTCTVVSVREGVVHYRSESGQDSGGSPSEFVNHVDRWLPEAA